MIVNGSRMRRLFLTVVLIGVVGVCPACATLDEQAVVVTPTLTVFSQWAVEAEASSQFGFPDWSVNRAVGAPEIQACKDDSRAWSSARGSGVEWLRLTYARPVYATEVRVYQSFGRGAISRVSLIDTEGNTQQIWSGTDALDPCPGVLAVPVAQTPYRVVSVLVDLDESRMGFWNQIDAVELIGVR
jgi:hypothetical protein